MKTSLRHLTTLLAVGAALACISRVQADEIDYSNTVNSVINFNGDSTFNVVNQSNPAWDTIKVTSSGAAAGLTGKITGTYTIGAVTNIAPGIDQASVTGTGTFVLHDGASNDLTGTLQWLNIQEAVTAGSLDIQGQLNLTNITYGGLNPVLLSFANGHAATNVLSFQFTSPVSLASLKNSAHHTSFSGSVTAPDGGTTIMLLGIAFCGLALIRRRSIAA